MRLYIDLATNRFVNDPNFKARVNSVDFKRGDSSTVEIQFLNGNAAATLTVDSLIHFGIKEDEKFDGEFLVFADSYTIDGDDYVLFPSFNTTALNEALNSGDSDDTNDLAALEAMLEVSWSQDGGTSWNSSNTITAKIANDVIKGEEGTPSALPNPEDYLTSRAVRYDVAQTLDSGEQTQARENINAESTANKSTDLETDQASDAKYPSAKAVVDWVTEGIEPVSRTLVDSTGNPMVAWGDGYFSFSAADSPNGLFWGNVGSGAYIEAHSNAIYMGNVGGIYFNSDTYFTGLLYGNGGGIDLSQSNVVGLNTANLELAGGNLLSYGSVIFETSTRKLISPNGYEIANWNSEYDEFAITCTNATANYLILNGNIQASDYSNSIDPNSRQLIGFSGSTVVDWSSGTMDFGASGAKWYNGSDYTEISPDGQTIKTNGNTSIDLVNRFLMGSDGLTVAADWSGGYLYAANPQFDYATFNYASLDNAIVTPETLSYLANAEGTIGYVNNALAPVVGSPVAAGGSAKCLVCYNGTNFIVTAVL